MPRNEIGKFTEEHNPWSEYRRMVMQALEDLNADVEKVEQSVGNNNNEIWDKLNKIEIKFTSEITALQVKAGVVGGLSGMVASAIIVILLKVLFKI